MRKGQKTRSAILEQALAIASQLGLSGLTIGTLAERSGLSKSGLFAHFRSKEGLQLAVIQGVRESYSDLVFQPAMRQAPGLPRLRAIVENWLAWTGSAKLPGGCIMIAAAFEFDDCPGPVRELISQSLRELRKTLARAIRMAVDAAQLHPDTDPEQLAFEICAIYCGAQLDARLFGSPDARRRAMLAFENLIGRAGSGNAAAHSDAGLPPAYAAAATAPAARPIG
ncbi:MAG: TetR/AcrR family transcriptional regulator [Burkholderiales bacterium]|nr:TetR/AcrR family transcriptional regulator [Burkholderiales bacterium]